MTKGVRVTVAEHERPRTKGRAPHKLFYRLGGKAIRGRLLTGGAASGTRSVHFAMTARGFASKTGRRWRTGEGERAAQYITREEALEGGEAGCGRRSRRTATSSSRSTGPARRSRGTTAPMPTSM